MWAVVAFFHLLKPNCGVAPSPFNSLDCFVNLCGDGKILMKILNHLILMIEFLFDPERSEVHVLCASKLYLTA